MQHQLIPPIRYQLVEEGVYRGSYPTLRNFRFLRRLQLKTIISLTPEPPTTDLKEFCDNENIHSIHYKVDKFKDSVPVTPPVMAQVLQTVISTAHHPIYIHCLDGANVSGIVVACLRRLENWSESAIQVEFERFDREGELTSEESDYIDSFKQELDIPVDIPPWLWPGVKLPFSKHPTMKCKFSAWKAISFAPPVASTPLSSSSSSIDDISRPRSSLASALKSSPLSGPTSSSASLSTALLSDKKHHHIIQSHSRNGLSVRIAPLPSSSSSSSPIVSASSSPSAVMSSSSSAIGIQSSSSQLLSNSRSMDFSKMSSSRRSNPSASLLSASFSPPLASLSSPAASIAAKSSSSNMIPMSSSFSSLSLSESSMSARYEQHNEGIVYGKEAEIEQEEENEEQLEEEENEEPEDEEKIEAEDVQSWSAMDGLDSPKLSSLNQK